MEAPNWRLSMKKQHGGRPNKFKPAYIQQARKLCEFGHTDSKLAEFFGVHLQTINNWKVKYPQFLYAPMQYSSRHAGR
jgi:hypothetical protein